MQVRNERYSPPVGATNCPVRQRLRPGRQRAQPQQIAGGTTHNAAYAYNAVDWQTSTTDDGMLSTYGFDGAARQRAVTIGAGSGSLATTVNGVGMATGIAEGSNSASLSYNTLDLPLQVSLPAHLRGRQWSHGGEQHPEQQLWLWLRCHQPNQQHHQHREWNQHQQPDPHA